MELSTTIDNETLASSLADAPFDELIGLFLRVDEIICDGYFTNRVVYEFAKRLPGATPGDDSL